MRVLIALFSIVAACFAGEVSQLQSGLLVLPRQGPSTSYYRPQSAGYDYYNQQEQTPDILSPESAGRRGVYFVQVPQERIQALKANGLRFGQNPQAYASSQYNAEQTSLPTVRYLPIQLGEGSQQQQQRQEDGQNQFTIPRFNAQQQQQQQQQQRQETSGFVANVEYSQVEPIQGPVYSYEPQQLTRILRYAPVY